MAQLQYKSYLTIALKFQVGKNLHVLSQIEGVDLEMYRDTVLPRVLEQVQLYGYLKILNICDVEYCVITIHILSFS